MLFGFPGCKEQPPARETTRSESGFSFTVHDVFYIKPPVDRVILTGVVDDGTVRVGDELIVHPQRGPVTVTLDMIEHPEGRPQSASKGDQVGLRLVGIRKEQPNRGDRVTAKTISK